MVLNFLKTNAIEKFSLKIKNQIKPFDKSINVELRQIDIYQKFPFRVNRTKYFDHKKCSQRSEDVLSTINCLKKLGVQIKKDKSGNYFVFGKGLGSLVAKKNVKLNFGNSGTLARLLIGVLSTTPDIEVRLSGDKSLNKRSMRKLINLMSEFGARFLPDKKNTFPLKMISTEMPVGINYNAGVSAQLKSAVS